MVPSVLTVAGWQTLQVERVVAAASRQLGPHLLFRLWGKLECLQSFDMFSLLVIHKWAVSGLCQLSPWERDFFVLARLSRRSAET